MFLTTTHYCCRYMNKSTLTKAEFAANTSIVHLHLCKDTYANSNDFNILLNEFERNKNLKHIKGYVSPYIQLVKVLRHYLYGLDMTTQLKIIERLNAYTKYKGSSIDPELLSRNTVDIKFTFDEFMEIFVHPIAENQKNIFSQLRIDFLNIPGDDVENMHEAFISFSNFLFREISQIYDVPQLELINLDSAFNAFDKVISRKRLSEVISSGMERQERRRDNMRDEYHKLLKGFKRHTYKNKKSVIERLNSDSTRALKRKYFVSDKDLISLLDGESNTYIDFFDLEKTISKEYITPDGDVNEQEVFKAVSIPILLEEIFRSSSQSTIVIQEFKRQFDYSLYFKLAEQFNCSLYPSSITSWKEDSNLRLRGFKMMNFIFGLDNFFKEYVQ